MPHAQAAPGPTTTPLDREALDTLAICSFRYVLGRKTYAVGEVCDLIEQLPLSESVIQLILRDIQSAKERDDFARNLGEHHSLPLGMDCDRDRILELYEHLNHASEARLIHEG